MVYVRHSSTTGAAANPNVLVDGPKWDAEHVLTQSEGRLLGRSSAGDGATEEIAIGAGLVLDSGSLSAIAGNVYRANNIAAIVAATIPDEVEIVETLGHTDPGDNGGARYTQIDVGDYTGAAWQILSNGGDKAWTLLNRDITPEMFGAFGDGEDCTAAFASMATFINGLDGGIVINHLPGAVYQIWPEADGAPAALLVHLVGVNGVDWYWNGSRLETDNTFDPLERQSVIGLQNCRNFNIYGAEYVESAWSSLSLKGGLFWNIQEFEEPWARNINFFNLKQSGGFASLYVASGAAESGGYASNINVFNAELNNVYYGLEFDKSGDNVTAVGIKGHNNGRIYVAANVSHHKVELIADGGSVEQIVLNCNLHPTMPDDKRQTSDIQIGYRNVAPSAGPANTLCSLLMSQAVAPMTVSAIATNGSGGSRLTVNSTADAADEQKWFFNVTGTTGINGVQEITVIDATHIDVAVAFVGTGTGYASVPGEMKDIDLHFQCVNDEAVGSNPLLTIGKLTSGGVADTSLRGYVFSNFRLSGSVKGYDSASKLVQLFSDPIGGTWTGENINNVTVEDFSVEGSSCTAEFNCAVITNLLFRNVYGSTGTTWTFTSPDAETRFINVETPSLSVADGIGISLNSVKAKYSVGNSAGNSQFIVGQGTSNYGGVTWVYNATAGNAVLQFATNSYANPVSIDGSSVTINTLSGGTTTINNGGVAPTGTGAYVRATSPTLVTPALGTPSSVTLTNGTGLPVATGISGLGSGVATFLATPSSANLASAVTGETGSGALVFGTSPTLSNPVVGTQSQGNNSTLAASTAYVDTAVAAKGTEAAITPTVNTSGTATTLGNGTLTGKAIRLGPTSVLVSVDFTVGSTTSFGTGYIYFSLPSPYNGAATAACSAVALFQDSGANFMGTVLMLSGTTQLIPLRGDTTTSATSPFTWATGDVIRFSIIVIGI